MPLIESMNSQNEVILMPISFGESYDDLKIDANKMWEHFWIRGSVASIVLVDLIIDARHV